MTYSSRDVQIALTYRLNAVARELDGCSSETRRLIRMACAGANGERPYVCGRERHLAQARLNEVVHTRTREAVEARRQALLASLQSRSSPAGG